MADIRIRIAKDKAELVKKLVVVENERSPFKNYADVIAFAAALGASRKRCISVEEPTTDPAPIRQDVFEHQGYDTVINLLAIHKLNNPLVLADNDEMDNERIKILEEYANGGLQILKEELMGAVDYLETVLLVIANQNKEPELQETEIFDLSKLLENP